THELKGKQKENFENFKDQALLSKRLATININVPIKLEDINIKVEPFNNQLLEPLLAELEFKGLAKKMLGSAITQTETTPVVPGVAGQTDLFGQILNKKIKEEDYTETPVYNTIENTQHEYILIDTADKRAELIASLNTQSHICFDTETTAIDPMFAEIVGMSFSYKTHHGYYIPLPDSKDEATVIIKEFEPIFSKPEVELIGQNIKYDIIILSHYGIEVKNKIYDTMIAHYLIEPDMRHNMDALSMAYLGYKPVSITELIGKKGAGQLSMRTVDINLAKDYAAEDADITLQLKEILAPKVEECGAQQLLNDIELPLIEVLASMEKEGVRIDSTFLNSYSDELDKIIKTAEATVYEKAGLKFNLSSPKQLGDVLFDHLKIEPKPKKTATGQYKTDEDVLQGLASNEIVEHILRFRQLSKLKSTYVDALPKMILPATGRVHTSFNQAVAATGRLSSDRPNLQNIPIKTDEGKEVRKAFITNDDNHVLLSADYSQIELRIIADISGDEGMLEAFTQGYDIHTATAAKIYHIPMDEVTKDQRRNAKSVNFGIIYGISAFGLSQNIGIPRKEAAEIIDSYFQTYPKIKEYMNSTVNFAKEHGYVQTIKGRRRYLRDINSANANVRGFAERNAINAPIQGSAADMIKVAMINIYNRLKREQLKSKMILQVHDELLFEVPLNEVDLMKELVVHEMVHAIEMKVPIVAEVGIGKNWLEAH
ncbi:MAG: DNA polymerase I, partial [Bacteroidetes bacterium]|nr:DNA polymerase I [Bacteroidota bacterium]